MGAQPGATPILRRTPLFEAARNGGGRMIGFAGWEMAVQFAGLLQEHKAVRERCGIFDISHMGVLRLSGAGAKDALQGLVPTDLFRIGPGEACYTVLLNEAGGILDDLIVYDRGWDKTAKMNELILVINAACSDTDTSWISSKLEPAGIQVADHKKDGVLLALQGPEAASQLEKLSGTRLEGMPRFSHRQVEIQGIGEAFVARTGYTGEDGFELLLNNQAGQELWNRCLQEGITPCGLGARDTLRLEAGMLLYGSDMNASTTPLEAGLGWLVHLEMPKPFVGRQALEQQSEKGLIKHRLVGVRLASKAIPREGYPLFLAGNDSEKQPIGKVCSGGWSPTLNAGIALAYVTADRAKIGTAIEIEIRGTKVPGEVVRKQFLSNR